MTKSTAVITGIVGLLAACLTGIGEFILHFDPLARFDGQFEFFKGVSAERSTLGHFIGVLGAPLYLVGCWHIHLMLRPANKSWSLIMFFVAAYGFVVGTVWIGSRASISALINASTSVQIDHFVGLYDLRYESLLQVVRLTVLVLSVIYIWLTLTGRSRYPRWMALLNPILLLIASFLVYAFWPAIGKYVMPIALNVAFFIFFFVSTIIANRQEVQNE